MAQRRRVAIHQPNFIPWLGYFHKINMSDVFVFLDDVEVPRGRRGSWSNRHLMLCDDTPKWFSVSISKKLSKSRMVKDQLINPSMDWKTEYMRKFFSYYSSAPFIKEVLPLVERMLYSNNSNFLSENNISLITSFMEALELNFPSFILASDLGVANSGTDRLIDIVESVSGDVYFCGGGSDGYLDESKFDARHIKIEFQNFQQRQYRQSNASQFWPGMTVLDVLVNIGPTRTRELLHEVF